MGCRFLIFLLIWSVSATELEHQKALRGLAPIPNDICKDELAKIQDFGKKLAYTPTPECCSNTQYIQAKKSFPKSDHHCTEKEVDHAAAHAGGAQDACGSAGAYACQALFVIDMQYDFTTGTFKSPCQSVRKFKMANEIAEKMESFHAGGGLVVLSKDYHPPNHCSFMKLGALGPVPKDATLCKDKNHAECECKNTLYDSHTKSVSTSDMSDAKYSRYMNAFPPHTVQDTPGAQFDPIILAAVKKIAKKTQDAKNPNAGNKLRMPIVVYKGFAPLYDSFSAFPHVVNNTREELVTGAWAIPDYDSVTAENICDPTKTKVKEFIKEHLKNPENTKMKSMNQIMKDKNIHKILVTGLVFDFCVKETALFAVENKKKNKIKVVTVDPSLTAPAFEGKPNLIDGLGVKAYLVNVATELTTGGVCLVTPESAGAGAPGGGVAPAAITAGGGAAAPKTGAGAGEMVTPKNDEKKKKVTPLLKNAEEKKTETPPSSEKKA